MDSFDRETDAKSGALIFAPLGSDRPLFEAQLKRSRLPTRDLNKPNQTVWALRHVERILGFVCLEAYGSTALLRSLVVLPESRGQGFGRELVRRALELARELRFRELWLATEDADGFFRDQGWRLRDRGDLPAVLVRTPEFASAGRLIMSRPVAELAPAT